MRDFYDIFRVRGPNRGRFVVVHPRSTFFLCHHRILKLIMWYNLFFCPSTATRLTDLDEIWNFRVDWCTSEGVGPQKLKIFTQFRNINVRSLLRAGVQPTLDLSTETVCRSNALAQERG